MNKKRLCIIIFALFIVLCGCKKKEKPIAQSSSEASSKPSAQLPMPEVAVPNPMESVKSPEEFSQLGFEIAAPKDAEDVKYSTIAKTTAQVVFSIDENKFYYRAAKNMKWQMLSGVYEDFKKDVLVVKLDDQNSAMVLTVMKTGGRLAYWSIGDIDYTLYTPEKAADDKITALIKELCAN